MESLLTADDARAMVSKEVQCYTKVVDSIKKSALVGRLAVFIDLHLLLPEVCARLKEDGFIVTDTLPKSDRGWVSWRDVDGQS